MSVRVQLIVPGTESGSAMTRRDSRLSSFLRFRPRPSHMNARVRVIVKKCKSQYFEEASARFFARMCGAREGRRIGAGFQIFRRKSCEESCNFRFNHRAHAHRGRVQVRTRPLSALSRSRSCVQRAPKHPIPPPPPAPRPASGPHFKLATSPASLLAGPFSWPRSHLGRFWATFRPPEPAHGIMASPDRGAHPCTPAGGRADRISSSQNLHGPP